MSPCEGCHAGCCRSFAVPITGADVLRVEATGLDFWNFACRWEDPEGLIARNYAPHLYFEDDRETPFVLSLLHSDSDLFPGTRRCQFLVEESQTAENPLGTAHCGIYESRPSACRAFPTRFDENRELVQLHDIPKWGKEDKHPVHKLCPRPWKPEEVDPIKTPADLAVAEYEMRFFHHVSALWNQSCGPWEVFPDFLRLVYSRRVTVAPAEIPATIPLPQTEVSTAPAQPQEKRRAA